MGVECGWESMRSDRGHKPIDQFFWHLRNASYLQLELAIARHLLIMHLLKMQLFSTLNTKPEINFLMLFVCLFFTCSLKVHISSVFHQHSAPPICTPHITCHLQHCNCNQADVNPLIVVKLCVNNDTDTNCLSMLSSHSHTQFPFNRCLHSSLQLIRVGDKCPRKAKKSRENLLLQAN